MKAISCASTEDFKLLTDLVSACGRDGALCRVALNGSVATIALTNHSEHVSVFFRASSALVQVWEK